MSARASGLATWPLTLLVVAIALTGCMATFDDDVIDVKAFSETYEGVDLTDASIIELFRKQRIDYMVNLRRTTVTYHRAFRVLNERGVGLADFRIRAGRGLELKSFSARTVLESGEVHELGEANTFEDEESIDGETVKFFGVRIPGVQASSIVEMHYVLEREGVSNIIREAMADAYPILSYDLSIYISKGVSFEIRTYNSSRVFQVVKDGQGHLATLHAENINASTDEVFSPPSTTFDPWWMMAVRQYAPGGVDLAKWETALNFVGERFYVDDDGFMGDVEARVDVTGCADRACRVARALAFVDAKTSMRGFSSLFSVRPLKQVVSSGTANSTERNLLLHVALESAGVESFLAPAVRTMTRGIDREFPAYDWFNHLVNVIPPEGGVGERLVLDASCTICAPGELPYWTRHAFAVEMRPARRVTGDFGIKTFPFDVKARPPASSVARVSMVMDLTVASNGLVEGTVKNERSGDAAHQEAKDVRVMSPKAQLTRSKNALRHVLADATLKDVKPYSCTGARCARSAHIASSHHVLVTPERLIVPLTMLYTDHERTFSSQKRLRDIYVAYDQEVIDRVTLRPPAGYVVDEVPPSERLEAAGFTVVLTSQVSADGVLTMTRTATYAAGVYDRATYADARRALQRYADWRQHLVTFKRAAANTTPTTAAAAQ